ncbi:MAG: SpoVR family protein [Firmicutes bacterium]|nr:SpoVR family protein [Alicyclobacillaceae bacterium]MCL6497181.1 SpoVR family protein [Bacillota bacterium]
MSQVASSVKDELERFLDRLWDAAVAFGLDPVPVDFEIVPAHAIYELAAYGMPGHYSHWIYGRDYWRMKRRMDSGQGRLYEMVIDTDPAVAYLLDSNTVAAQKLVMAHVLGHADVFKNHLLLKDGPKQFHHTLAASRERFAQYAQEYGADAVEAVLDRALSIQDQVSAITPRPEPQPRPQAPSPYVDLWGAEAAPPRRRVPRYALPTPDLLGFLARESPILQPWERDILEVVRLEGLYHAPKRRVKILHEGWATYCHHHLLELMELSSGEAIEVSRVHAQVATPDPLRLNPYWFGWQFAESLVEEYGFKAARAIWMEETDAGLVRNYLDQERMRRLELYRYRWVPGEVRTPRGPLPTWDAVYEETEVEALRSALANALAAGPPEIQVVDVTPSGVLELRHTPDDSLLDPEWTQLTLEAIRDLWGGGVVLYDGNAKPYRVEPRRRG